MGPQEVFGPQTDWLGAEKCSDASVVAIGNFDGVHLGHAALVRSAKTKAVQLGIPCFVLTFDPHPSAVLGKGATTPLATLRERCDRLIEAGADHVLVQKFDTAFAGLTPLAFVEDVLMQRLGAKACHVGSNFRFGQNAAGNVDTLRSLGMDRGFSVECASLVSDGAASFSSSRVRVALAEGDTDDAAIVLGRPYAFSGTVVRGEQRGRTIGFPTANLGEIRTVVPKRGVYAVRASKGPSAAHGTSPLFGVMNIGVRPTVSGEGRESVEVHLFDFDEDLYGQELRVELAARLRDEAQFPSFAALKAQIEADALNARRLLANA